MDKNTILNNELKLISAHATDVVALYDWFADEKQIASWGGPGFTYPMSPEDFLNTLKLEELASFWMVNSKGDKIGFCQFYMRLQRYHLGRLVVSPEHRGKGLGQVLVTLLLQQVQEHSPDQQALPQASLFVLKDNPAAIGCYLSLGFVETPYPEAIPGGLENCAYMVKDLVCDAA